MFLLNRARDRARRGGAGSAASSERGRRTGPHAAEFGGGHIGALARPSRREGRGPGHRPHWGHQDPVPVTPSQPRVAPSTRHRVYGAVPWLSGKCTCAAGGNRGFLSHAAGFTAASSLLQPGRGQPPAQPGRGHPRGATTTPPRHHPPPPRWGRAGLVQTQAAGEGAGGDPAAPAQLPRGRALLVPKRRRFSSGKTV